RRRKNARSSRLECECTHLEPMRYFDRVWGRQRPQSPPEARKGDFAHNPRPLGHPAGKFQREVILQAWDTRL
ncbi:hypothetical protein L0F63_005049, partial [Massospora cicadina]